ncbi:toxin secretion/phage lysis holin [Kineothrix alysoides]|uniref:Toxin secretion/phage lysis holin n=1 Tax=Kineothrix alysoides TaxID=1469948 RepID=A0A4R1R507_9FIRM|nr:phage holin family protein [Kineothrix alysoides]TCL60583.1 toxin secretion/phage lysis holin [Kineothrix alysoides]
MYFKEMICRMNYVFAAIGLMLGRYLGGMDGLLYALVAFVVVDYITGVLVAIYKKKLSSAVGFKGIAKKIIIFLLVGIAHVLDSQVMNMGSAMRTAVIFFYLSNEGISILENVTKMGLPVPQKLKDVMAQIQEIRKGEK